MLDDENSVDELEVTDDMLVDDDWDTDVEPEADEPEDTNKAAEEPEKSEEENQSETEKPAAEPLKTEPKQESKPEPDQTFELKHLGTVTNVSKDEVVTLAQKGMDYDRIRGKLDTLTAEKEASDEQLGLLKLLADESQTSIDDLLNNALAADIAQRDNKDPSVALAEVKLLRKEQSIKRREEKLSKKDTEEETAKLAEKANKEKIDKDAAEFAKAFPDAAKDVTKIPKEVWDAVNKGENLTAAYTRYENLQLKLENAALKKQSENKQKTTGSRTSVGKSQPVDEFLKYFDSD